MEKITPKLLKGFRDFDPHIQELRLFCIEKLQKVFVQFGYMPIDTPILEFEDILLGKGGGETDKQVYRFEDKGNRKVVIRFDLTVPFARYVAMNTHKLPVPFYRSQVGKVFRGENPQKGRYREFIQCDFDIIGLDYTSLDFTILQTIIAVFSALSLPNIKVHISHRGLLNEFLSKQIPIQKISKENAVTNTLRIIDKIRKIGHNKTSDLLSSLWNLHTVTQLIEFSTKESSNQATMDKLAELGSKDSESFIRLHEIFTMAIELGIGEQVVIDPSITRGLDYYTGFVCETFVEGYETLGSVCSGGRYNNLTKMFSDNPAPGVGASIGLDRLLAILEESSIKTVSVQYQKIVIFPKNQKVISYCHLLQEKLRNNNFSTQVYPASNKLKLFFKYAEKIGADFVCVIDSEELINNTITIKNQWTREQYNQISIEKAIHLITHSTSNEK